MPVSKICFLFGDYRKNTSKNEKNSIKREKYSIYSCV